VKVSEKVVEYGGLRTRPTRVPGVNGLVPRRRGSQPRILSGGKVE
jgi:hypothetical protein